MSFFNYCCCCLLPWGPELLTIKSLPHYKYSVSSCALKMRAMAALTSIHDYMTFANESKHSSIRFELLIPQRKLIFYQATWRQRDDRCNVWKLLQSWDFSAYSILYCPERSRIKSPCTDIKITLMFSDFYGYMSKWSPVEDLSINI